MDDSTLLEVMQGFYRWKALLTAEMLRQSKGFVIPELGGDDVMMVQTRLASTGTSTLSCVTSRIPWLAFRPDAQASGSGRPGALSGFTWAADWNCEGLRGRLTHGPLANSTGPIIAEGRPRKTPWLSRTRLNLETTTGGRRGRGCGA